MYDAVNDHVINCQRLLAHYVAYRQTTPLKLVPGM